MAYPLHRACMKDEGAELVAALVRAGAQLESRKFWWGGPPSGRTQCWEGTPLFTAACIARYDSVQELVWQGASLRASANAPRRRFYCVCSMTELGHQLMMLSWQLSCTPPHTGGFSFSSPPCAQLPVI